MTFEAINVATAMPPKGAPKVGSSTNASANNDGSFDAALTEQRAAQRSDQPAAKAKHDHKHAADRPTDDDKQQQAYAAQTETKNPADKQTAHNDKTDASQQAGKNTDGDAKAKVAERAVTETIVSKAVSTATATAASEAAATAADGKAALQAAGKSASTAQTMPKQAAAASILSVAAQTTAHTAKTKAATLANATQAGTGTAADKLQQLVAANGTVVASNTAKDAVKPQTKAATQDQTATLTKTTSQNGSGKTVDELLASLKTDTSAKNSNAQNQSDAVARAVRALMPQNPHAPTTSPLHTLASQPQVLTGQQAATTASLATATTAAFTAQLRAPVGGQGWNQALQQQSLRLIQFGGGRAQLTLYPAELGQIQVSLKMGAQTQLHFAAPNAQARAAVQAALPQLQQAFADSGINLGQATVSEQGYRSFGSGSGQQSGSSHRRYGGQGGLEGNEPLPPVRMTRIPGRTAAGGIDIFA